LFLPRGCAAGPEFSCAVSLLGKDTWSENSIAFDPSI